MKSTLREQSGMAFVHLLLLMIIIAGIGTVMFQRSLALHRDGTRSFGEMLAVQAAEGGLALARHHLSRNGDWRGTTGPIGECRVHVDVTRSGEDAWVVTATAIAFPQGAHGTPVRRSLRESIGPDGVQRLRLD